MNNWKAWALNMTHKALLRGTNAVTSWMWWATDGLLKLMDGEPTTNLLAEPTNPTPSTTSIRSWIISEDEDTEPCTLTPGMENPLMVKDFGTFSLNYDETGVVINPEHIGVFGIVLKGRTESPTPAMRYRYIGIEICAETRGPMPKTLHKSHFTMN